MVKQADKILKVGIAGYGKMGRLRHDIIKRHHPQMSVKAVCDPFLKAAPDGILGFTDPADFMRQDLDVIFVCTPNHASPAIVIEALNGGRHVFCEKPPGRTEQDVLDMMAAERANPTLKLKFGFNHRYHHVIREARALVDSKSLGEILWVRGVYGKTGSEDFEQQWRNNRTISGGGILLDQGIHMVDLCRYFLGDFKDIHAMVTRSFWKNIDVEDNAFALMKTADDRVAMLHSSSTHWKHKFLLEIFLTDGYLVIDGILSQTNSYGMGRESLKVARKRLDLQGKYLGNPQEEVRYFTDDASWQMEIDDFLDAVLNNRPVTQGCSSEALEVMKLVHRIYEADPSWSAVSKEAGAS